MVVLGTNCSQKKFEKYFGPKKGDLERLIPDMDKYRDKYPK
jgi:hypothetical protein